MFALLVGFCALLVAGCAAYFSVQGLATLYAGAFISVCIMAGSLELGKLVAASYLHRHWDKTSFLLKVYLIVAVVSLMGITSLGIFGFLTSAYQQSHVKVEMLDVQKESIELKKQTAQTEINNLTKRIETLNEIRLLQEQRVQSAGNYKIPREQAYEAINKANVEITSSQDRIKQLSDDVNKTNQESIMLKAEESKSTDIGTLKFVAQLFNVDVSTVVKWFTLIIILVFDPLAVSLVLAYNNLVHKKQITSKEEKQTPKENKILDFIKTSFNVKYKDK
jgi:TolA-binding protein